MKYLALALLLVSTLAVHAQEEPVQPGQVRRIGYGSAIRIESLDGHVAISTDGYHVDLAEVRETLRAEPDSRYLVRYWYNETDRLHPRRMEVVRIANVIKDSMGNVLRLELATEKGEKTMIDPQTAIVNGGAAHGEILPPEKVASRIRGAGRDVHVEISEPTRDILFSEAAASGNTTALEQILSAESGRANWLEVRGPEAALKDLGRVKATPNGQKIAIVLEDRLKANDVNMGAMDVKAIVEHAAEGAARR